MLILHLLYYDILSSTECLLLLESSALLARDHGLLTLHTIIKTPILETKGDPASSIYSHSPKKIHGSDSKRPAIPIILQIHTGKFCTGKTRSYTSTNKICQQYPIWPSSDKT